MACKGRVKMKSWKKVTSLVLFCLLLFSFAPVMAMAEGGKEATTNARVNFRTQATVSSDVMETLEANTKVEVLSVADDWAKVRLEGKTGYIYADFIQESAKSKSQAMVTIKDTQLRSKAEGPSKMVKALKLGSEVYLLEVSKNAYKVSFGDSVGYVKASDVVLTGLSDQAKSMVVAPLEGNIVVFDTITVYMNSEDALYRTNPVGTYPAGDYEIFKNHAGMINITRYHNVPGAWINPEDNKDVKKEEPQVPVDATKEFELKQVADTYMNAADAAAGKNSVGTYQAGKYFIYRSFAGMINISKQEKTPGAWINPDKLKVEEPVKPIEEDKKPEKKLENEIKAKANVNLRDHATSTSNILKVIRMGEKASMVGKDKSWLKVEYEDQVGYTYQNFWDVPDKVMNKFDAPVEKKPLPDKVGNSIAKKSNNIKVYLDPGHNGRGQGAVSTVTGEVVDENTINYRVALHAKNILEEKGYKVYLSKSDAEEDVELSERAAEANRLGVDIFVSIHCNSFSSPGPRGTIGFAPGAKLNPTLRDWERQSYLLTQKMTNNIGKITGSAKVVKDTNYVGSLYINRNTNMISSLLELGFITNYQDAVILDSSKGQKDIAREIANGIDEFFGLD